jgi:hypothetical protein
MVFGLFAKSVSRRDGPVHEHALSLGVFLRGVSLAALVKFAWAWWTSRTSS